MKVHFAALKNKRVLTTEDKQKIGKYLILNSIFLENCFDENIILLELYFFHHIFLYKYYLRLLADIQGA